MPALSKNSPHNIIDIVSSGAALMDAPFLFNV
jgi:hypothetical protein